MIDPKISQKTKELVMKAAKELNYKTKYFSTGSKKWEDK